MPTESSDRAFIHLCQFFDVLSDKTRLRMVLLLAKGERSVNEISAELDMAQPLVSHHLGLLRMNGVLLDKREGKRVLYGLNPETSKVSGGKLKFAAGRFNVVMDGL
jgi:DNA-binding transcriptional ArsR family regulator